MTDEHVETTSEAQVVAFLKSHPDFLNHHPSILLSQNSTESGGKKTSSLVERQLDLAKKRLAETEKKLAALIENGRRNDRLAEHIQRLSVALLKVTDLNQALVTTEQRLKNDIHSEQVLWLIGAPLISKLEAHHHLRELHSGDAFYESVELILKGAKPRVGRLRGRQRELIQDAFNPPVESVAWVPLHLADGEAMLVIGSEDPDHFDPSMSTDVLERIAELVSTTLSRLSQE